MQTDEIILQAVITHRLDTISQEMGLALEKSSRSPIFAEACDFACGICDGKGNLVSQLNGIPILAAAGTFSVKAVLKKYQNEIQAGDIFIVNDPYQGGNHLPDIGIITPVFFNGELVYFCVSRAHHGDIGGSAAGSYNARATEIFQEGIRIPPLRLAVQDKLSEELLELIAYNTRNPDMLKSDLFAQIGANNIGKERLLDMIKQYGLAKVKQANINVLKHAEKLAKKHIAALPPGTYEGEEWLDDDGFQDHPLKIKANITVAYEKITVDFEGTDKQAAGFVNSALVTTTSASYIGVLWALSPEIPRNSGAFKTIEVIAPAGSLVNPDCKAPVTLSTLHCACEIIAAIFKAFAKIVPERIPAGFGRYCGPSFFGMDPRNNKFYVGFGFCCLGSGGGSSGKDGLPYMAPISNYGGVRAPNNETNEIQYPLLTLQHQMEPDTAGAGKFRGGPGIRYEVRFYSKVTNITMFGDGMKIPPYSLMGGLPGSLNRNTLSYAGGDLTLPSKMPPLSLGENAVLSLLSSGGGGWGNPFERDPASVLLDYQNGIISVAAAESDYGVIIRDERIDWAKTNCARQKGKN